MKKLLRFFAILAVFGVVFSCATTTPGTPAKPAQSQKSSVTADSKSASGDSKAAAKDDSKGTAKSGSAKKQGKASSAAAGVTGFISHKIVPFFKAKWPLLLIILGIGAAGGTGCYVINKKSKKLKPQLKKVFTAVTVLVTAGLIAAAVYNGNAIVKKFSSPKKTEKVAQKQTSRSAYINAATVNVREGPAATKKVVGHLKKNDSVIIIDNSGAWWKIRHNNIVGYVRSDSIKYK